VKFKWCVFYVIGLAMVTLALSLVSCSNVDRLETAENYLKQALDSAGNIQDILESYQYSSTYPDVFIKPDDYDTMLWELDNLQSSVEDALSELQYMKADYDPPER
jgi:hypothetical protein